MSSSNKKTNLSNFARHSPRVLRRQTICQLAEQYFLEKKEHIENMKAASNAGATHSLSPSCERFHGALLFVDISGFTSLSLKLNVEDLKRNINEYFTKMLDIVEKFDGDVVKFAGDAIYIIWQTKLPKISENDINDDKSLSISLSYAQINKANNYFDNSPYAHETKVVLEKATSCALEINSVCCGHQVEIGFGTKTSKKDGNVSKNSSTGVFGNFIPSFNMFKPQKVSPIIVDSSDESIVRLNVHSGLSVGLMATFDIGLDDRWECVVIGDPIAKVAEAESMADKGQLVICPESHAILHNFSQKTSSLSSDDPCFSGIGKELICGCILLKNGFFLMKPSISKANSPKFSRSRSRSNMSDSSVHGDQLDGQRIFNSIDSDIEKVFTISKKIMSKDLIEYFKKIEASIPDIEKDSIANEIKIKLSNPKATAIPGLLLEYLDIDHIRKSFSEWVLCNLSEDLMKHVHQVAREDFLPEVGVSREVFWTLIEQFLQDLNIEALLESSNPNDPRHEHRVKRRRHPKQQAAKPIPDPSICMLKDSKLGQSSKKLLKKSASKYILQDSTDFSAELRTVVVLFMKIDAIQMNLVVDDANSKLFSRKSRWHNEFGFLNRTLNEEVSDNLLLNRLQQCIEVIIRSLHSNSGQLRQFIVDDKGTVCIGTFGLRGAVNDDDCAAALEAAKSIIIKLKSIGLSASIGITSGQAYCGLVGSPNRHEYCIMSPSTNLSARLMSQAPSGTIFCDSEIQKRDRSHDFDYFNEITAKGYPNKVRIFKPIFPDIQLKVSNSHDLCRPNDDESKKGESLVAALVGSLIKTSSDFFRSSFDTQYMKISRVDSSLVSTKVKSPKDRLIRQMTKSDFFVKNESFARKKVLDKSQTIDEKSVVCLPPLLKLCGRNQEITMILDFLFSDCSSKDSTRLFDYSLPVKMVLLQGMEAIGKSAILNSLSRKIYLVSKQEENHNISILKNRPNSFYQNIPFLAWKSIIQEIILKISRARSNLKSSSDKALNSPIHFNDDELLKGLEETFSMLSKEYQDLKPLLSFCSIIEGIPENLSTQNLYGVMKINRTVDLLAEIIKIYPILTSQILLLSLDDLQSFDSYSLNVLFKVWNEGHGVLVLSSFRLEKANSPKDKTSQVTSHSPMSSFSVQQFPFYNVKDHPRYLQIDIGSLDEHSSKLMIEEVLCAYNLPHGPELVQRVFDISGGQTIYSFELAKTIAQNPNILNNFDDIGIDIPSKSIRIEEIICRRFDQLDYDNQTILKVAAVICSQANSFSLGMILYVLKDEFEAEINSSFALSLNENNSEKNNMHLLKSLYDIILDNEFVALVGTTTQSLAGTDKIVIDQLNEITLKKLSFEFNLVLEQLTIYKLLLHDQILYLHSKIASYYQDALKSPELTQIEKIKFILEQAFHWQCASQNAKAMECFYYASIEYANINDTVRQREYLFLAYNLYYTIKQESDVVFEMMPLNTHDLDQILNQSQMQETGMEEETASSEQESSKIGHPISQLAKFLQIPSLNFIEIGNVYHICQGNPVTLNIIVRVLIDLSKVCIKLHSHQLIIPQIISEAIQIAFAAKTPFLLSLSSMLTRPNQLTSEEMKIGPSELFVLNEFQDLIIIAFFLFSFMHCMPYQSQKIPEFDEKAKLSCLVLLKFLSFTDFPLDSIHYIHSRALLTIIPEIDEPLRYVPFLIEKYDPEKISRQISLSYGFNLLPFALSLVSRQLLLKGDFEQGLSLLDFTRKSAMKLNQVYSFLICSIPTIYMLLIMNQNDEAAELFQILSGYTQVFQSNDTQQEMFSLFIGWVHRYLIFFSDSSTITNSISSHSTNISKVGLAPILSNNQIKGINHFLGLLTMPDNSIISPLLEISGSSGKLMLLECLILDLSCVCTNQQPKSAKDSCLEEITQQIMNVILDMRFSNMNMSKQDCLFKIQGNEIFDLNFLRAIYLMSRSKKQSNPSMDDYLNNIYIIDPLPRKDLLFFIYLVGVYSEKIFDNYVKVLSEKAKSLKSYSISEIRKKFGSLVESKVKSLGF